MTTPKLPTRETDGGIVFEQVSHVQEVQDIARRVAAHTSERCAKWHDEQERITRDKEYRLNAQPLQHVATLHRLAAEKFRAMED